MAINLVEYASKNQKINFDDLELKHAVKKMFIANMLDHFFSIFTWTMLSFPLMRFISFHTLIFPEHMAMQINYTLLGLVSLLFPIFHITKTLCEITFMQKTLGMKIMHLMFWDQKIQKTPDNIKHFLVYHLFGLSCFALGSKVVSIGDFFKKEFHLNYFEEKQFAKEIDNIIEFKHKNIKDDKAA